MDGEAGRLIEILQEIHYLRSMGSTQSCVAYKNAMYSMNMMRKYNAIIMLTPVC